MKKYLFAGLALASLAGSAVAADLPSRKGPAPVYAPPPPVMTWTGFYAGLNAGGTWGQSESVALPLGGGNVLAFLALQSVGAVPTSVNASNSGFLGGGQIGYNYQFYNHFLVGLEADIQGLAASSTRTTAAGGFAGFGFGTTVNRSIDYIGTVRGRLGYLVTPTLLLYGTGGLAYGQTNLGYTLVGPAPFLTGATFSDTRVGWTAGAGAEWMFMPNWSAKLEYLYYDLGQVTTQPGVVAGGGNFDSLRASSRFDGHIVRAGLNYHFNWSASPIVAKY
jgi:outer membrane immunogenic protein